MRDLTPDATLDIRGQVCPMTYVRTKLKLETLEQGQLLEVLLRGEEPTRNVPRSAREEGHEIVAQDAEPDGTVRLFIRKAGG